MHRSGATIRQDEDKLHSLITQLRARWDELTLTKSTPSMVTPQLEAAAMQGLQLQQQPFTPPINGKGYFVDNMIGNLLDTLEESLLHADNMVILVGAPNSGKTCSVAQLINSLYEQHQIFTVRGSAAQSAEQAIRSVLGAFRSTTPTHVDDCLEQLSSYLAESEHNASINLLVLEDSDLMDRQELQLLLNHLDHLNESLNGNLKLLFSSAMPAEQLLSGLNSDQISQGRVEEFRQPVLDQTQTIDYIDARLMMAGSDEELPLSDRSMQFIVETSAGLPGEIDQAAANALNSHYKKNQLKALLTPTHWIAASRQSSRWLAIGGTLLLSGVAMAFFSANAPSDRDGTTVREIAVPSARQQQPAELQLVSPTTEPTATVAEATAKPAAAQAVAKKTNETAAAAPASAAPAVASATAVSDAATTTAKKAELVARAETPAKPVAAKAAAVAEPVAPEPVAPEPVAVAQAAAPAKTQNTAKLAAKPATTSSDSFVSGVISGHQWILRRDPKRFTAQLSAGWSERDLRLFATRNGMTNKTAIYRTERNGKGWFSLIHGDFSSPAEARGVIAELPAVWRSNAPWIRSFSSVQKVIK